ncbi:MAG: FAD-dependent oxidoreductase, partial [Firmicutes bacterium]|nr:FAD-dependent oxidoreductase [Bacillota bacterium]
MINTDICIIGAGPAGLAAAIEAAQAGAKVTLIDENHKAGGQLFKQIHKFFGSKAHQAGIRGFDIGENLVREARNLGVDIRLRTDAYGIFEDGIIGINSIDEEKNGLVKD